jgi:starch-binding outer membrane protein, SusD/RagB family
MKYIKIYILILTTLFLFSSCKDYVSNVDPLIDQVADEDLNDPSQLPFLIKGVKTRFANATGLLYVIADGLSDQFFFDQNVPGATFPTYGDIDRGIIFFDNNSVRGPYRNMGQYRFLADNLIERVGKMTVGDASLKNDALFTGYFYGGFARFQYATYIGLTETQGGSPIDGGPFIASAQMYDLAIAKFNESLKYTTDAATIRIVNSVIARAYLYKEDYASAATFAKIGMASGDADFTALHNVQEDNEYWANAGPGRSQYVADFRFKGYIDADPNEANRIKLVPKTGNDGTTIYYVQTKYSERESPGIMMTWQENNLMLAELTLRGQSAGDALTLVNAVRASHSIAALTSVDLDALYVERDKELFVTANRLPDERRFNKWHLGAGTWQYLPITDDERNSNPNL